MRTFVVGLSCLALLNGCATWKDLSGETRHRAQMEREAQERLSVQQQEQKESEGRDNSLFPGNTIEKIQALWGKPQEKDYLNNMYIYWYDIEVVPIFMGFKDGKLVSWKYDKDTVRERELDAKYDSQISEQKKAASAAAWSNALSALAVQTQLNNIQHNQETQQWRQENSGHGIHMPAPR